MSSKMIQVVIFFLFAVPAFAARMAIVESLHVEVREAPRQDSNVIIKLKKGDVVTASNLPTEGFYKIRTEDEEVVGWVSGTALSFVDADPTTLVSVGEALHPWRDYVTLRLLSGYSFFKLGDVDSVLGTSGLIRNGFGYGGELGIFVTRSIALLFRYEQLQKKSNLTYAATGRSFSFSLTSTPWMAGLEWELIRTPDNFFGLALLGGTASGTQLTSTEGAAATPNQTVFVDKPVAALLKADLGWFLNSWSVFYFEAGYRYQKSKKLTPGTAGNGADIFQSSGVYVPIALDFSGLVLLAGVGVVF